MMNGRIHPPESRKCKVQSELAVLEEASEIASIFCAAVKTARRNSDPGAL
jgi:hypothetical protein